MNTFCKARGARGSARDTIFYITRALATRGDHLSLATLNIPTKFGGELQLKRVQPGEREGEGHLEERERTKEIRQIEKAPTQTLPPWRDLSCAERIELIARFFGATSAAVLRQPSTQRALEVSHFHAQLSFSRDLNLSREQALRCALAWVRDCFGAQAYALVVAHQDTEHLHLHVCVGRLLRDGTLLRFTHQEWKQLPERWAQVISLETRRPEIVMEYRRLIEETNRWKRDYSR